MEIKVIVFHIKENHRKILGWITMRMIFSIAIIMGKMPPRHHRCFFFEAIEDEKNQNDDIEWTIKEKSLNESFFITQFCFALSIFASASNYAEQRVRWKNFNRM